MNKLLVIGSISTDFNVKTHCLPQIGETVAGDNFSISFGGKGANQAIAAARLGAEVLMAGTVGNDMFADQLINNLVQNQINVDYVERCLSLESGAAHITKYNNDNSIIYIAAANDEITLDRVEDLTKTFKEVDYVVIQNEIPIDIVIAIIKICHDEDVKVIYNPAPAETVDQEIIDKVSLFTPNESEFYKIFPDLTIEEGLMKFPNKMIITLGSEGVAYYDGSQVIKVPSYTVDVTDTTGAGDTFNGALAFALSNNKPLKESIYFANLAAALSIQKYGAQEGMPTADEIKTSEDFDTDWDIY